MQSNIASSDLSGFQDPQQEQVPMSQLSAGVPQQSQDIPYNPQSDANTQVADQQAPQPAPGTPQMPSWNPDPQVLAAMQQMVLHPNPKVRIATMQQLLPQVQQSITQYVNNMFAPNPMASTSTNSNMFQSPQQSQPPASPPTSQQSPNSLGQAAPQGQMNPYAAPSR
jgi:hypothetical protein